VNRVKSNVSLQMQEVSSTPADPNRASVFQSRWMRVDQVLDAYPLRRTILFWVLKKGKVKSFILKRDDATQGCRLIDRESLEQFLQEEADKSQ
jgi:hypothetical protein